MKMKRAILKESIPRAVMPRAVLVERLDQDLPNGFMAKLMERLWEEDARLSPVTEVRMHPFFVSYIHANMIESVLMRGWDRRMFKVETRYWHGKGPNVPPAAYRVIIPLLPAASEK